MSEAAANSKEKKEIEVSETILPENKKNESKSFNYKIKIPEPQVTKYLMENNMVSFDPNISEEVLGFGTMLPAGEYKLKDQVTADDDEIDAQKGDAIIAHEDTPPSDTVLGVEIFPVIHTKSMQKIYVSLEDIK